MYYQTTGTYPEMNDIGPNSSMVACVGSGYQSSVDFASDTCRTQNGTVDGRRSALFDNAMAQFLRVQPAVNGETIYSGPSPDGGTVSVRGMHYSGGRSSATESVARLLYYVKGNQTCGRGSKIYYDLGSGSSVSICQLYYINGVRQS